MVAPILTGLLCCIGGQAGIAAEESSKDLFGLSPAELADISVVSASLAPQRLADSPASVTVITAEDIRQLGARDLYDVLRQAPSLRVDINNRGRPVVSVRGVHRDTSSQLLFLLDGHVLNEAANGSATFLFELSHLPLENISRIEVVRGPGSAMYGSNAFMGVINILTRTANGFAGTELTLRSEFESDGNIGNEINLLTGHQFAPDRSFGLNLNLTGQDGARIPVAADIAGRSGEANTNFDQLDLQAHGTLGAFTFKGRYTDQRRGEFVGPVFQLSPDDRLKWQGGFIELDGHFDVGDNNQLLVRSYFDYVSGETLVYSMPKGTIASDSTYFAFNTTGRKSLLQLDTSKAGLELRATNTRFHNHQITYGVLLERHYQSHLKTYTNDTGLGYPVDPLVDISATGNFGQDADRTVIAPYVEDLWQLSEQWKIDAGLRMDHYSDFGETFNPRLGVTWQFHPRYSLRALYGTAFRAPDFRSLFLQSPVIQGNPDLTEEEVRTLELGLTARPLDNLFTRVTLFHNALDQLINQPPGQTQIENIDCMTSRGVELEARYQWANGAYLSANYSYVDARLDDGSAAPDEPRNSGSAMAWLPISERIGAGLNLYWQDASPRADGDTRGALPGYQVLNWNLIGSVTPSVELGLSIHNLLNQGYAYPAPANTLADDYRGPRRGFLAQLRITF